MTNEIKEILDKFDKVLENYELDKKWGQMSVDSICHLFPNEMIIIKDYITNLQEKYERMKENAEILSNGYNELEKRNEKAIELIKKNREKSYDSLEKKAFYCNKTDTLLNILQGEDKE